MSIFPVVLCGGSGTRLWPMSRGGQPKQFLALAGDQSLLQTTLTRVDALENIRPAVLVSNAAYRFQLVDQLAEIGLTASAIILEPVSKNTAVAIAAAAHFAIQNDPNALLLVLPSDHVIQNAAAFHEAVETGTTLARDGRLVTFGVVPTAPHTGFGYIRKGALLANGQHDAYDVDAFIEKPDTALAIELLASGDYLWNSGMFLFRASTYLDELKRYEPEVARLAQQAYTDASSDAQFLALSADAFAECPSISVDYAVFERTDRAAVIAVDDLGWNDIGSWSALHEIAQQDPQRNALIGDVLQDSVSNSYIRAEHRMVAAIGVSDLVIVETADAVLVAHRDLAKDVKRVVESLSASGRRESVTHRRVMRPWGSYESIDQGERFQVKRIVVNPGAQLSLQLHHHRAEHWIVVKGTALVTNGNREDLLTENQSTYIPVGVSHRLFNPGKIPLELIEVQSGAYLGEDDIVRLEDRYGRAGTA
ncbi:mannose-1-phosphate guanylyltransferase/mannose-6-phosphate isomerase [Paraburkholderia sp. ZP32-5]|uniref:mannose-1-phosphate guanylyltransferase/mannose-6-phosphate isomerase n=1 Tax=Paraburkholderia sp. ZP32-5 TaxID=2883245 RepID=UPI001F378EE5|nr:mannose-1-phosphate guanylyltransferase/mannose-6-phosphate isomerase [Paraburkholderia sp. ZP32-5]